LIAIPVIFFMATALRFAENIPYWDDYGAMLQFASTLVQKRGLGARFLYFLAAQSNEYKLFFAHGVVWAQVALTGRINLAHISVLGDCAIVALALLLWSRFLPGEKDLARRLAFFVPVSWLLFQLQYWEAIDWPVDALQNLWVIVFVWGAVGCLLSPSRRAFAGAVVLYALAIGAMGNGMLLLPLGLLILVNRRWFVRAAVWLAASAVYLAAYAYRYNIMSSQSPGHGSVFCVFLRPHPVYALVFIGNAGAIFGETRSSLAVCLAFALFLLALFAWLFRRGYGKRNPFVFYCVLFLLATALGVASMRAGLGLRTSVTSRYTIFGAALIILAWTGLCEEVLQQWRVLLLRNPALWAMIIVSMAFSIGMDVQGFGQMVNRRDGLIAGVTAFENSPADGTEGPMLTTDDQSDSEKGLRAFARAVMQNAIRAGVYAPPQFPPQRTGANSAR
jgi:hypothetical protein